MTTELLSDAFDLLSTEAKGLLFVDKVKFGAKQNKSPRKTVKFSIWLWADIGSFIVCVEIPETQRMRINVSLIKF